MSRDLCARICYCSMRDLGQNVSSGLASGVGKLSRSLAPRPPGRIAFDLLEVVVPGLLLTKMDVMKDEAPSLSGWRSQIKIVSLLRAIDQPTSLQPQLSLRTGLLSRCDCLTAAFDVGPAAQEPQPGDVAFRTRSLLSYEMFRCRSHAAETSRCRCLKVRTDFAIGSQAIIHSFVAYSLVAGEQLV